MNTRSFVFQNKVNNGDIFKLKLSTRTDSSFRTIEVYLKFNLEPVIDPKGLNRENILNNLYKHFVPEFRKAQTPICRWSKIQFVSCEEKTIEGQDFLSSSRDLKDICGGLNYEITPLKVSGREFIITLHTSTEQKVNYFLGAPPQDLLEEIKQQEGNDAISALFDKIKKPFLNPINLSKGCRLEIGMIRKIGKNKQFEPIKKVEITYRTDNPLP